MSEQVVMILTPILATGVLLVRYILKTKGLEDELERARDTIVDLAQEAQEHGASFEFLASFMRDIGYKVERVEEGSGANVQAPPLGSAAAHELICLVGQSLPAATALEKERVEKDILRSAAMVHRSNGGSKPEFKVLAGYVFDQLEKKENRQ